MTVQDILEQAKALSAEERKELTKLLIDTLDMEIPHVPPASTPRKTGAEIVAMIEEMEPIELVDSHIEDAVEWVKAQRQKRQDYLKSYRGEEHDEE